MKIRTQIALGFFILGALLIALGAYSVIEMTWLSRINQSLTQIDFQARKLEIQQFEQLEDIFNYDLKYLATQDGDYLRAMNSLEGNYEQNFADVNRLLVSDAERALAAQIQQTYSKYKKTFTHRLAEEGGGAVERQVALDNQKYDLTQSLRGLYPQLEQATQAVMQSRLDQSEAARRRAARMALLAGLLAIALALALSWTLARKISLPLARLIEGTRRIALGNFGTLIPVEGRNELSELATAFNSMARQLEQLEELKRGLVSHVSHELKSPLASLRESTDLLLGESLGPLNDKQRRLLGIGKEKSELLSRRIGDLLDISRIEAGVMEYRLERADVAILLKSAIESVTPLLREKNLQLQSRWKGDRFQATFDAQRILQVMENLFSNAMKFARENSAIRVDCERWPGRRLAPIFESWNGHLQSPVRRDSTSEYLVVSVEDKGIGIPSNEIRKVFEKFYQSKRGQEVTRGGTGLGLAISRSIVLAHDGVLWVESEINRGSCFRFALPTALPPGVRKSRQAM